MNSVTMFRCITCDKTIICNHQGKKDVTDHIDTPNQKSKAEVRKNQTQITFSSECDNTILQKLTFAELKMAVLLATYNIPSAFYDTFSTSTHQIFPNSKMALKYRGDSTKDRCILYGIPAHFLFTDWTSAIKHQPFSICIDASNDTGVENECNNSRNLWCEKYLTSS